jgi:hypothetical protein
MSPVKLFYKHFLPYDPIPDHRPDRDVILPKTGLAREPVNILDHLDKHPRMKNLTIQQKGLLFRIGMVHNHTHRRICGEQRQRGLLLFRD